MKAIQLTATLGLALGLVACGGAGSGALNNNGNGAGGNTNDSPPIVNNLPTTFTANQLNISSANSLFKANRAKGYQSSSSSSNAMFAATATETVPQLHKLNETTGEIEEVVFTDSEGNEFGDVEVTEVEELGENFIKIELRYKSTVTVCANIDGELQSINLVEPAVQAHLDIGGTLGPCEGDVDETVDDPDVELTLVYDLVEKTFVHSTEWDLRNSQIHDGYLYAFKKESDGWLYRLDPKTMLTEDAVRVTNLVNEAVDNAPYKSTSTRFRDFTSFGQSVGSQVTNSIFTYQFVIDENDTFLMWRGPAWGSADIGLQSFLFADSSTLHVEENDNPDEFNILFHGLNAPSSNYRNFSLIKTPNGKLWMFRFIQEDDDSEGFANIHEISFSEAGERQTTTTVVDVEDLGVPLPSSNEYRMNNYNRFIPFEAGFITLSLDGNGDLQAQKTFYNEINFLSRIIEPADVVTPNNRLTQDAWVKGQFYYWRAQNKIHRIKFEENATQEEILDDATLTDWLPISGQDVVVTTATETKMVYIPTDPMEEVEVEVIAEGDLEVADIVEIPEDLQDEGEE